MTHTLFRYVSTAVASTHQNPASVSRLHLRYVAVATLLAGLLLGFPCQTKALTYQFGPYTATYIPSDPDSYVLWAYSSAGNGTSLAVVPESMPLYYSGGGIGHNGSPGSLVVDEQNKKIHWTGGLAGGTGTPNMFPITIASTLGMAGIAKFEVVGPADVNDYYLAVDGKGSGRTRVGPNHFGSPGDTAYFTGSAQTLYGALKTASAQGGSATFSPDPNRPGILDPDAYNESLWSDSVLMETAPGATEAKGELLVPLEGGCTFECSAPQGSIGMSGGSTFTVAIWITNMTRIP